MLDPDFTAKLKAKLKVARDILSEIEGQLDSQTGPPANSAKPIVDTVTSGVRNPNYGVGQALADDFLRANPYGQMKDSAGNPYKIVVQGDSHIVGPDTNPPLTSAQKGANVLAWARTKTGMKYQWGGTGNPSFDCSGLTQWAYRKNGIEIGRTTYEQIKNGREVPFEEAQDGDLIFSNFSAPNTPEHVSINIAGPDKVFEAGDPIGEYNWGDRGPVVVKRYVD